MAKPGFRPICYLKILVFYHCQVHIKPSTSLCSTALHTVKPFKKPQTNHYILDKEKLNSNTHK